MCLSIRLQQHKEDLHEKCEKSGKLCLEKSPNIAKIKLYLAINMTRIKSISELL